MSDVDRVARCTQLALARSRINVAVRAVAVRRAFAAMTPAERLEKFSRPPTVGQIQQRRLNGRASKGRKYSAETIQRMQAERNKGNKSRGPRPHTSASYRAAVARIPKSVWRERSLKGAAAARMARPTSLERMAWAVLDALGVDYQANHRIGRYVVDVFVPSQMLVIECDGAYWHSLPGCAEKDAARDGYLRGLGFRVARIREDDFKSGQHEQLIASCVGGSAS